MPDWKRILRERLAHLNLPPEREADVVEELAKDLEETWNEAVASGADESSASRATLEELGDDGRLAEEIRRAVSPPLAERLPRTCTEAERNMPLGTPGTGRLFGDLARDLRYAARVLVKTPALAAVAVAALALGIGANTAIFTVVNGVLLDPLPYRDAGRLMMVWAKNPKGIPRNQVSPPDFRDWQSRSRSFAAMAAFTGADFTLTGVGEPARLAGITASPNLFEVLGVRPAIGTGFDPADGQGGGRQAVILGNGLWRTRFGADPGVVGRAVSLNGQPYLVAGVMPGDFYFMVDGIDLWAASDFGSLRDSRSAHFLQVVGRLRQGAGRDEAQAETDTLAAALAEAHPETNRGWGAAVVSLREQITGDVRRPLLILLGAVGFVLLIACANVANLFLARAAARQKEIALRAALGASRARIARQLLAESAFLALLAGALGTLIASGCIRVLLKLKPDDLPRAANIGVDWHVLGFTLVLSLLTGVLFGIAPVWHARGVDLAVELKQGGRRRGGATRLWSFRRALMVSEVAIAVILLAGAGLLIRSFANVTGVDPGFRPDHVLAIDVSLTSSRYASAERQAEFYREAVSRLQSIPGVESAGAAFPLPLGGGIGFLRFGYAIEGRPATAPGRSDRVYVRWVSPRYFSTMGIPLLAGRDFSESDDSGSPPAVIVDETLVRRDFPGGNAIGKRVMTSFGPRVWREIVGVVGGVRQTALDVDAAPHVYLPYRQMPLSTMSLVVKTRTDPQDWAAAARTQIANVDPEQPVTRIVSMKDRLTQSVALRRFSMWLLSAFAGLSLVLSATGVYGVLAYSQGQRTHEMGIRMALGARPRSLFRLMLAQGMTLVLAGTGVGTVAALALTPLLRDLLYAVAPGDPIALSAAGIVLSAVGLLACLVPARRATRVNPVIALRHE